MEAACTNFHAPPENRTVKEGLKRRQSKADGRADGDGGFGPALGDCATHPFGRNAHVSLGFKPGSATMHKRDSVTWPA